MSEAVEQLTLRTSKIVVYLKSKLQDNSNYGGIDSFTVLSSKHPHEVIAMWKRQGGIYRKGYVKAYGMTAHFVPWGSIKQIEFNPDSSQPQYKYDEDREQQEYFESQEEVVE